MRRRAFAAALVVMAALVVTASAAAASRVRVVRCPTRYGASGRHPTPARIRVDGNPASVAGLVAYTNAEEFLIGPAGLACSGEVGVDGTADVFAWPKGAAPPRSHSHEPGLSLFVDPDCVGCEAELACPFFTAFARSLDFPCTDSVPGREQVAHLTDDRVAFTDPPGVRGDGWPSGGDVPANGVDALFGPRFRGRPEEVMKATCTLPSASRRICTASLDDAIGRY